MQTAVRPLISVLLTPSESVREGCLSLTGRHPFQFIVKKPPAHFHDAVEKPHFQKLKEGIDVPVPSLIPRLPRTRCNRRVTLFLPSAAHYVSREIPIRSQTVTIESKVDSLTPEERSVRMARIQATNSKPELVVRRLLHQMGYRYRLHRKDLPGKPDIVFGKRRKVIFIHGCFWHRHSDPNCRLARLPKTRLDFWLPKLSANASRDVRHEQALKTTGWEVAVIWECELKNFEQLENRLRHFLEGGPLNESD